MGDNLTTSTPWVAYISCDANTTGASQEWGESYLPGHNRMFMTDIFTLARDRGAVSAVSTTSLKGMSCSWGSCSTLRHLKLVY